MELYHGGSVSNVEDGGLFRGVFASACEDVASSHGYLHKSEIEDDKILTDYSLNYELDHSEVRAAFEAVCAEEGVDAESDLIWEAVIEEADVFEMDEYDVLESFEMAMIGEDESVGMASWVAQRMRGQVARKLGYIAVEMDDEHGTSYLVLPGAEFSRVER